MKLEDIQTDWEKDSEISRYQLTEESLNISKLHSKYYKIYINEKRVLNENQERFKNYELAKSMYYQGKMSKEELDNRKWKPFNLLIQKSDIQKVVDADSDIIDYKLRIHEQNEKTKFVEDILKSIHQRSYIINNAITNDKFQAGG